MKEISSRAFVENEVVTRRLRNVDDIFRGFIKSPDGGVELEVELFLNSNMILEIDVYIPEKEEDNDRLLKLARKEKKAIALTLSRNDV